MIFDRWDWTLPPPKVVEVPPSPPQVPDCTRPPTLHDETTTKKTKDQRCPECAFSEESGAVVPSAGICEGGTGQLVSLPQSAEISKMRMATAKIVILPLALGCVAFSIFFLTSEAASESGFTSISKGMTEAQVRSLLGDPHGVRRDPDQITYGYGGLFLKWCTMEVYFDAGGRVTSKFHDH